MMASGRHFVDNRGRWPRRYVVLRQEVAGRPRNGSWGIKITYATVSRHFTVAGAVRRARKGNRKAGLTA